MGLSAFRSICNREHLILIHIPSEEVMWSMKLQTKVKLSIDTEFVWVLPTSSEWVRAYRIHDGTKVAEIPIYSKIDDPKGIPNVHGDRSDFLTTNDPDSLLIRFRVSSQGRHKLETTLIDRGRLKKLWHRNGWHAAGFREGSKMHLLDWFRHRWTAIDRDSGEVGRKIRLRDWEGQLVGNDPGIFFLPEGELALFREKSNDRHLLRFPDINFPSVWSP